MRSCISDLVEQIAELKSTVRSDKKSRYDDDKPNQVVRYISLWIISIHDLILIKIKFRCTRKLIYSAFMTASVHLIPIETFISGVKCFKLTDACSLQLQEFDDKVQLESLLFEFCHKNMND